MNKLNLIIMLSFISFAIVSCKKKTISLVGISSGNGSWDYRLNTITHSSATLVSDELGTIVFMTDNTGYINIPPSNDFTDLKWNLDNSNRLIITYVGYFATRKNDTLDVTQLNSDQFKGSFSSFNKYSEKIDKSWYFTRR